MTTRFPFLAAAIALTLALGNAPAAERGARARAQDAEPAKAPAAEGAGTRAQGAAKKLPAFPGAEGHGRFSVGGRGGQVVHVTNLNASGEGSFLWAVNEVKGPRTIVFDVSGVIDLKNKGAFQIGAGNDQVTIAGETSPGGIAVYNYQKFSISSAEQVIMRFIRLRGTTINRKADPDGIGIGSSRNVIIDHCSVAGSCDETISVTGQSADITVQWTGFDESRSAESHSDYYNKDSKGQWHNYGGIFSPKAGSVTVHHSLFAHHSKRCPLGKRSDENSGFVEAVNNVVYNYSNKQQAWASEGDAVRLVNCYFKLGPDQRKNAQPYKSDVAGVIGCVSKKQDGVGDGPSVADVGKIDLTKLGIDTLESAEEAFESVLQRSGALPRDATSQRMVEETRKGSGRQGYDAKIQDDIAALQAYPMPADSDRDGMPDAWEKAHGLDKDDASDAVKLHPSGYTNLEVYCHYLAERLIAGELPWKDDPKVVGR